MKKTLATLAAGAILAGVAVHASVPHGEKVLIVPFRGIPMGTTLIWNNGKYVPKTVSGYESKADYPDSFWVYDTSSLNGIAL